MTKINDLFQVFPFSFSHTKHPILTGIISIFNPLKFRNEIGDEERVSISCVRPEASPARSTHRAVVDRAKAAALMEDVHKPQMGFLVESPNTGQQYYRKYFLHSDHRYGSETSFWLQIY